MCYIIDQKENQAEEIVSYFWLSNKHVKELYDSDLKWFVPYEKDPENKVILRARVSKEASSKSLIYEKLIELKDKINILSDDKVKKAMLSLYNDIDNKIKNAEVKNNNTSPYVVLLADNGEGETVQRMISHDLYELANFENEYELFSKK